MEVEGIRKERFDLYLYIADTSLSCCPLVSVQKMIDSVFFDLMF